MLLSRQARPGAKHARLKFAIEAIPIKKALGVPLKIVGPGGVERSEGRSERFTEFREETFKLGGQGG